MAGVRGAVLLFVLLSCISLDVRAAQLSPQARLGRLLFFDARLSASGRQSCASCHDAANAYATRSQPLGLRAIPSLRYLTETPRFTRHAYLDRGTEREDLGPTGGFMADGRADSLRDQALLPLLDPAEMANRNIRTLAARLRALSYARDFRLAFGTMARDAKALVRQAASALERFEIEDSSFHPYSSRFDRYLRGQLSLSADELAGLELFSDPAKGNCAACHTVATGPQGRPPVFTDYSYHALGVPRNPALQANRDPAFFDLGLCGPVRRDLRREPQYCGYFKTPTLRNVARRGVFFHNGRFTTLADVMHFYVERDTDPQRWYPLHDGRPVRFDDLPAAYRGNVDLADAPLDRQAGATPALDAAEIARVIAFLGALNDAD